MGRERERRVIESDVDPRADPRVVSLVLEKGTRRSSGAMCSLFVVTVPAGKAWTIEPDETTGGEHVRMEHPFRTIAEDMRRVILSEGVGVSPTKHALNPATVRFLNGSPRDGDDERVQCLNGWE